MEKDREAPRQPPTSQHWADYGYDVDLLRPSPAGFPGYRLETDVAAIAALHRPPREIEAAQSRDCSARTATLFPRVLSDVHHFDPRQLAEFVDHIAAMTYAQ